MHISVIDIVHVMSHDKLNRDIYIPQIQTFYRKICSAAQSVKWGNLVLKGGVERVTLYDKAFISHMSIV